MSNRMTLAQLRVAEPCTQSWEGMSGDGRARYCTHCDRHVHNLSALTQDEAQRLICDSAGSLCVAYFPNADGSPQTLEHRTPLRVRRFGWTFASVLGCLSAVAAACVGHVVTQQPAPESPPLAGRMVGSAAPIKMGEMVKGDVSQPATRPTTAPATQPVIGQAPLVPPDAPEDACHE